MRRRVMWAAAAALLAFGAGAALAQEATRLTVEGRGEVARAPDMAFVSVGVTERADTARAALDRMAEASAAVLTRLEAEGVAAGDVQTGVLDLGVQYSHRSEPPEVTGYVASTVLDLRVRDLAAMGALLDAVVSDGANELRGLRFALAEPRAAEDEARRLAWADAMAKARLYADAAGLEVGRVVSAREGVDFGGPAPMMEMARATAAVPIAEGEVTAAVTLLVEVELVAPE